MPRFRLKSLFTLTALLAILLFGVSITRKDPQTGEMIAFFAAGLILAWLFLRVPLAVWQGMAIGFSIGILWYWSGDIYHAAVPADRLFEFVLRATWCSVLGGFLAFVVWRLRKRTA